MAGVLFLWVPPAQEHGMPLRPMRSPRLPLPHAA